MASAGRLRRGRTRWAGPPALFAPWVVLAAVCTAGMWWLPGEETIPYHVGYAAFALAYGLELWPLRHAAVGLAVYTLLTGTVLAVRASSHVVGWGETAEIPLMCLLMVLMVWHVRRRQAALAEVTRLAARDRVRARRRELLARLTSHEMRTPLTIAMGFLDLAASGERGASQRADLDVVRDELGRLSRAADRLLRMIRFEEVLPASPVDIDALLDETAQRWSAVADRTWRVRPGGGVFECSPERLRACLDTLLENAVRYTRDGDTIRMFAGRQHGRLLIGVADAGQGMSPELVAELNRRRGPGVALPPELLADARAQTGLGLELVREIVQSRSGRLVAGRAAEGGALLVLVLPTDATDGTDAVDATVPARQRPAVPAHDTAVRAGWRAVTGV